MHPIASTVTIKDRRGHARPVVLLVVESVAALDDLVEVQAQDLRVG